MLRTARANLKNDEDIYTKVNREVTILDPAASKDAVTHVNESGGLQSHVKARYDLIPAEAVVRIAQVVGEGSQKYGKNNWRLIAYHDHINHALMHLQSLMLDDTDDDHLGHALTRLAFAVAVADPKYKFLEIIAGAANQPKACGHQSSIPGVTCDLAEGHTNQPYATAHHGTKQYGNGHAGEWEWTSSGSQLRVG